MENVIEILNDTKLYSLLQKKFKFKSYPRSLIDILKFIGKQYGTFQIVRFYFREFGQNVNLYPNSADLFQLTNYEYKILLEIFKLLKFGYKLVKSTEEGKDDYYMIYLPFEFYNFEPRTFERNAIGKVLYPYYLNQKDTSSLKLDFEILCQTGKKKVHKFVIESLNNDFFNLLLENRQALDLSGYSCSTVEVFIQYLYLGSETNIEDNDIFSLLDFADYYRLDVFFNIILQYYLLNYDQDYDSIKSLVETYIESQPKNDILINLNPMAEGIEGDLKYKPRALELLNKHLKSNHSKMEYIKTIANYPSGRNYYFSFVDTKTFEFEDIGEISAKGTVDFKIIETKDDVLQVRYLDPIVNPDIELEIDEINQVVLEHFEMELFDSFTQATVDPHDPNLGEY